MATLLSPEIEHEDWVELAAPARGPLLTRAEWLWTIVGLGLLVAFLALVVVDYPLRAITAIQ
jgi:hypothetical protein